jgi:hypothetical protein
MAQPQPSSRSPDVEAMQSRLTMLGMVITPSTVRPDTPLREPLQITGVSLSRAVIEVRDEAEAWD